VSGVAPPLPDREADRDHAGMRMAWLVAALLLVVVL
jgi:hypothetical protein